MKVKCVKILNARGTPAERSSWIRVGGVYHVLGLWISPDHNRVRLLGEESIPALFDLEMFEVVTSQIPNTWIVESPKIGCLSIEPAAWARSGFWEEFYDGQTEAIACFEVERALIIASDP